MVYAELTGRYEINPDRVPNPVGVKNVKTLNPSRQFGNLFNSYAQSFNKAYGRTGGLFERPFKRKRITSDEYFVNLIYYIHYNPTHHGFVDDFYNYQYSSYKAINNKTPFLPHYHRISD